MAPPNSTHPTDQTLNAYGLGKLDDEQASTINDHLETCPDCRQRVAGLTSDSFLGRFRQGHQQPAQSIFGGSLIDGTHSYMQGRAAAPPPPADTLPPGLANHPDYEIKRELGRGGMGVVYLAHNTMMGRDEVLKVMGRHIMERPGVFERFQREIRAVAKLRHPNIVAAYHAFRIEGGLGFAMEHVEGLDLARLVKAKGPLSVAHAAYFTHQAALGLQHAHEKGLIHRDIKPHNLMLTHDGKARLVKVLDFGLAKATREEKVDAGLTSEGQALGTPDYIAPEQIVNALDVDIRADLYSLGGTLFYLLTGRPPFQATSLYDIYQAHMSRDAEPLNLIRPEVPAELAALVAKMMAKEPKRRFQTPGEVAEALLPFFKKAGAPSRAPVSGPSQSARSIEIRPVQGGPSSTQPATDAGGTVVPAGAVVGPTVAETPWEGLIDLREAGRPGEASAIVEGPVRRRRRLVGAVAWTALLALPIALGVILKLRASDGGTLIVEVNEPGASVTIDREPVIVTWDAKRKRAEIRVPLGEREVEVSKDGFKATGKKVTISDGDRRIVTAELELIPPAETAAKEDKGPAAGPSKAPPPVNVARPVLSPASPDKKGYTFDAFENDWLTEGDELVQTRKPGPSFPLLLFGDPNWADYEFTIKAKMVEGSATYDSFGVVFRSWGPESRYMYAQAMTSNHCGLTASVFGKKDLDLKKEGPTGISLNVWYSIRVKVRGDHIEGFISDGANEAEVFNLEDHLHPNGRVGLMTLRARCRFKDIKVTAPDGTVLWEGLPEGLPGNAAEKVPRINKSSGTIESFAEARADGFHEIYNSRDLSGWKIDRWKVDQVAPNPWRVKDGHLIGEGSGDYRQQTFLLSEQNYSNFILRFEFWLPQGSDSGVAIWAEPGERPSPLEINLRNFPDDIPGTHAMTGAFRWSKSGLGEDYLLPNRSNILRPSPSWNEMTVTVWGRSMQVILNGHVVQELNLEKLSDAPNALPSLQRKSGRVGFQSHTGSIRFRNIQINELNSRTDSARRTTGKVPGTLESSKPPVAGRPVPVATIADRKTAKGLSPRDAAAARVAKLNAALEKPIPMKYPDGIPLGKLIDAIKTATKGPDGSVIPIYVDPYGVEDADKTMDSAIRINLENQPLKITLRRALKQLSLDFCIKEGLLFVSEIQMVREETNRVMRVPSDGKPASKAVVEALENPLPMKFPNQTSIGDVTKYLKNVVKLSNGSNIPIDIDQRGLDDADKTIDSTIRIDLEGIPLRVTLNLLLRQLGMEYCVEDGILSLTTIDFIPENLKNPR